MKHILYTSKICKEGKGPRIPDGLLNIYSTAKENNKVFNITGLLAYHAGNYLQVIEGPESNIDKLYQNILHDTRHTSVRILSEGKSLRRYFTNWRFESGAHLTRDPEFERFFYKYEQEFKELPQIDQDRLAFFFRPKKVAAPTEVKFKNQLLSMKRWPEMHRVGQTTEVINLCATLLHSPQNYNELINKTDGLDRKTLNHLLKEFEKQGVLETHSDNVKEPNPIKLKGSFYQKMRAFINTSLH